MAYPYRVVLTEAQRAELRGLVGSGIAPARILTRARILLKANHGKGGPGWSDAAIAGALDVNPSTVLRVRRQFVREGLEATLARKRPDRVYARSLDGAQEAHLIALTCGTPPAGHARWSLRLLADELVRREVVETVSYETVRQTLKKTRSSPGGRSSGASPRPPTLSSLGAWRTCSPCTSDPSIRPIPSSALMRPAANCSARSAPRCRWHRALPPATTRSTSGAGSSISSW